jgi:RNA polymerase sigma factor (sigma-70 family)
MPTNSLDLTGLFRRAVEGDNYATLELLEHFRLELSKDLESEINPKLKTRVSVADVLQELSLQLIARKNTRSTPKPESPTRSVPESSNGAYRWIRRITIRRIIDLYRKHMRAKMRDTRRELSLRLWDQSGSQAPRSIESPCAFVLEQPSERLRDYETRCVVQNSINQLRPIYRDVILLKFHHGLSTAEIAQQLQISKSTVAKRFRRGLEKLKESPAIGNLI